MSASSLKKCDRVKQIFNFKILTDGLKVYIFKVQYVRDIIRPQHYLKQEKISKICKIILLSDDADSAKQPSKYE